MSPCRRRPIYALARSLAVREHLYVRSRAPIHDELDLAFRRSQRYHNRPRQTVRVRVVPNTPVNIRHRTRLVVALSPAVEWHGRMIPPNDQIRAHCTQNTQLINETTHRAPRTPQHRQIRHRIHASRISIRYDPTSTRRVFPPHAASFAAARTRLNNTRVYESTAIRLRLQIPPEQLATKQVRFLLPVGE